MSNENSEKKKPAKRGRKPKPKPKSENEPKQPKKRGRKPKNNIIVNEDPKFDGEHDEDITVKLNYEKKEKKQEINAYKIEDTYQNISIQGCSCKSEICWNCSHKFQKIYSMPIKLIKNIFYTYGDFCSNECCLRYAYDNYSDNKYYEIKSLLNYRNTLNGIDKPIILPENKYLLKKYGGPLTYEEYINNDNCNYNIDITNCIHINHVFLKNINKYKNTEDLDKDLKIYRKSKLFKSDINKLLNLD